MHVYVHVPFCARRCSYCDFAIAVRRSVPTRAYVDAVLREWRGWQSHPIWAEAGATLRTVYFGGGTPSRLEPAGITELIEGIARLRPLAEDAEVTLEANPDDVTLDAARAWRSAGVNRVSLGAQSFDEEVLRWMHRTHTATQVERAVDCVRSAGIAELSLDLIFGLPAALARDWDRDLARALRLAPEHLSLYGLTVEDHTPLGRWTARGEVVPVDEERYAAEYLTASAALAREGYDHYEVSNAARPGHRARHNGAYWRRAPFIGLGPSAHSGFGRVRQWNLRDWAAYREVSEAGAPAVEGREELDPESVALEEVYLGLRTVEGLPAHRLPAETVRMWTDAGWARPLPGGRVGLTPEGWLRLDALAGAATP